MDNNLISLEEQIFFKIGSERGGKSCQFPTYWQMPNGLFFATSLSRVRSNGKRGKRIMMNVRGESWDSWDSMRDLKNDSILFEIDTNDLETFYGIIDTALDMPADDAMAYLLSIYG